MSKINFLFLFLFLVYCSNVFSDDDIGSVIKDHAKKSGKKVEAAYKAARAVTPFPHSKKNTEEIIKIRKKAEPKVDTGQGKRRGTRSRTSSPH